MADFYEESAARLAAHLEAGRDVVLLAEGDPLFYGSYMYMHDRLADRFHTEVVPGVTSVAAASAAVASPLVRQTDVLTVLPGTMPEPELARRLADTQGAVIMKLGRTFPAVLRALEAAGRDGDAYYVERASTDRQVVLPVKDVDPDAGAVLLDHRRRRGLGRRRGAVRGRGRRPGARSRRRARPAAASCSSSGSGPPGDGWLTPEVAAALAEVDHVVGYAPYVNRVPQRPGLRRHASGNTVEVDRARLALDLARSGERVAVVSGGDAGVFGMASAVFEAAQDARVRRRTGPRAAGDDRRAGGRRAGRRTARRGLRGAQPVGPAQAVAGHRRAAGRGRAGRPGAGGLQPGVPVAHHPGRGHARRCCSSTGRPAPSSSSDGTSGARASGSRSRRWASWTPRRSTCGAC